MKGRVAIMRDASDGFRFNLFVSYSHQSDSRLSRTIDAFLESFHKRVPKHSRTRLSTLSVCIDGSDFRLPPRSAAGMGARDVPHVIVEHLVQSRELLVLCSAAAASSSWVNQEIDWFVKNRGPEAIRLALTEGADPFVDPERYFAPSLLAHNLHRNICYDLRGFDRARAQPWSRVADFHRELVRLAADLNGLAAGDIYPLWLEEERRRARTIAFTTTVAACLILAGIGFGVVQRSARQVAQANEATARAEAAQKESARQVEEQKRKTEEEKRKVADANARTQQALRLVSDAFERLYRAPSEAVQLATAARALEASNAADRALTDAYRVAIFRNENRRQARRLTGSGPGYLASRWSESNLSSVISSDGRYLVVITPRGRAGVTGPDGKPMPGELYLIDNETQRPVQLENCRPDDITRRVEYVGFDTAIRQVFVTRHYNLMAYSLSGDCLGTVPLECCTKSPIHLVEGYFSERYLLAADTKGGLWLADPTTGRAIEVRSEWARDPVTSLVLSADASRAVVISESGRATLLSLRAPGRPAEIEIARDGILAAAFHPETSDVVALTGTRGLAQVWRLSAGRPALQETFALPRVALDSVAFTSDGVRLVAIADDLHLYVLQSGSVQPVATLNYPIDWRRSRRVPNHYALQRPGKFEKPKDPGDRITFPDSSLAVHRVATVAGQTWLLTVRKPNEFLPNGPAFLVEGSTATALPDRDTDVFGVESLAGSTWLHTSEGLYQVTSSGVRMVLPPKTQVAVTAQIDSALWFGTTQGAWRVRGDSIERFSRSDLHVTGITQIDGRLWFASTRGAYRLDKLDDKNSWTSNADAAGALRPEQLSRVTDEATSVRRVVKIRDSIWMLTGSESEPGPALLVRDLWTRALPARTSHITDIVDAGGATWLLSNDGLYRVEGEAAKPIDGIKGVDAVKHLAGQIIAFQKGLLGGAPAFAIRGDRAIRLIPDGGVTQTVAANGAIYFATARQEGFSTRSGPLYRLSADGAVPVTPPDSQIETTALLDGELWLQVRRGSRVATARLQQDRLIEVGSEERSFLPLATQTVEGSLWALGEGGACLLASGTRRCFQTPGRQVIGVRRIDGRWWLLSRQGVFDPGPAYRIDGDAVTAIPDEQTAVSDVVSISGATWLVTQLGGRPGPLRRAN